MIVFAAIWILAALTVGILRYAHAVDPERLAAARLEIIALQKDFSSGQLHTRCGIHKRLYTFVQEYQQAYLLEGEYSRLLASSGNAVRLITTLQKRQTAREAAAQRAKQAKQAKPAKPAESPAQ